MINTNNILNAWILIEQLSEGDIKKNNKTIKSLKERLYFPANSASTKTDFYQVLHEELKNNKHKKAGIILYLSTFRFQTVIKKIANHYKLDSLQDDIADTCKFSIAVVFDKDLNLIADKIFVTMSYYILKEGEGLSSDTTSFKKYEENIKEEIKKLFSFQTESLTSKKYTYRFNEAFLSMYKLLDIDIKESYYGRVNNIETDISNLHSFYIDDLNSAKISQSENLKKYFYGIQDDIRLNLDPTQNTEIFKKILQPKNYPLGHFFSKFPASLMQQVAINLAINDKNDIHTVNGPPGTGKTTLLKDIFAELVVRQAKEICDLDKKNLYSVEDSKFGQTKLPDKIASKNIVVASSNNGAVQNIVNELPLFPDKNETFKNIISELEKANYFKDIANSDSKSSKFWGLFSKEGGRQDNMNKIIKTIKKVVDELKSDDFQTDPDAYNNFIRQYKKVKLKQDFLQKYSEYLSKKENWAKTVNKYKLTVDKLGKITSSTFDIDISHLKENIGIHQRDYDIKLTEINNYGIIINIINWIIDHLFNGHKKEEQNKKIQELRNLSKTIKKEINSKQNLENKLGQLQIEASNITQEEKRYAHINVHIPNYERNFNCRKNYEDFEEETYWYTSKDLEEEALLFIFALRVKKQFLYENRNSLSAACYNWIYKDKKSKPNQSEVVLRAWEWINFTIPVISTTFASFHRMFKDFPKNSTPVGNLFIDEAGQAVPQAVVGALLKSKRVLAVGDPAQIKPVNTLDSKIISLIGSQIFKVSEKYVSGNTSVQTIMDQSSQFGYYKDKEQENWIGVPLWVHRRCLNPMFSISNAISYNNRMVLPKKVKEAEDAGKAGCGRWCNIKGPSCDKFVKRQADFLKKVIKIITISKKNSFTQKDIFVITPFRHVANELIKELDKIGFTMYKDNKPTNVGTVHTFQGKENKIVFLVLGASYKEQGAARWAVKEPNIINVAATRAKNGFFIIGDKALYKELDYTTINLTIKTINEFNKKLKKISN